MNTGDWVFCEFKLKQIKKMEGDRVISVTDGYFETSSYSMNNSIFPMTKRIKVISEEFERSYQKLHDNSGRLNLNFPDFNRWYIETWAKTCKKSTDDNFVELSYKKLYEFEKAVLDEIKNLGNIRIGDVFLFRQNIF